MQDFVEVIEVLFLVGPSYRDVININTNSKDPLEEVVHCPLEDGGSRCHAKWQSTVPKQYLVVLIVTYCQDSSSNWIC